MLLPHVKKKNVDPCWIILFLGGKRERSVLTSLQELSNIIPYQDFCARVVCFFLCSICFRFFHVVRSCPVLPCLVL